MFRIHSSRIPLAVLALAICTGTLQANNTLLGTPTVAGGTLKCDTTTGPAAATTTPLDTHQLTLTVKASSSIGVVPTGTTNQVSVSVTPPAGLTVSPTTSLLLASASATAVFTFTVTAGTNCTAWTAIGAQSSAVQFVTSQAGGVTSGSDLLYTPGVTVTVTNPVTSPLTVSPNAITLSCTKDAAGTYTGSSQVFNVTSSAVGAGTAVTVDSTSIPTWLQPMSNGSLASATAIPFTAALQTGCAGATGAVGTSKVATLKLMNAPAAVYQTLKVTVQVVGPSQLSLTAGSTSGSPISIPYTKNQSAPATGGATVKTAGSNTNLFFGLDTTSLPPWLTVNITSGQTAGTTGLPLVFSVTKVADSLTPGIYPAAGAPAQIHLKVAGYADTIVYISLTVQNVAATLSVAEGVTRNLAWSVGQPLPTATITALSSGSPIAYSIVLSAGTANPSISLLSGLAYGFGTQIPVTFDPLAFAGAQPGAVLTGTVTIHWSATAGTDIPVVFNITINSPSTSAGLTGISPSNLPTSTVGQTFLVTLYGTGFVSSSDPAQKTTVGVVTNPLTKAMTTDSNINVTVVNAATIVLVITVPTLDALLPWTTKNDVILGVCNPNGASCSAATNTTATLTIGAGPTIQTNGVTSASTFAPVVSPAGTVAPYDILTIFGSNFCTANGTGCASGQVLYPTLDSTLVYGTTLSPDNVRNLSVTFYPHVTPQLYAGGMPAPLLFATNNQINLVVPGGLITTTATTYDIVVKFGTTTASTSSPVYTVTSAASDPGVFVIDGVNQGAIVLQSGAINGNTVTSAARLRAGASESDTVSIYMTGLGNPLSGASNTTGGSGRVFTDCLSPAAYKGSNNNVLDGAVIQSSLVYPLKLVPCFDPSTITVKVGNQTAVPAAVIFAGWAPDAIAGLYQVNVTLPTRPAGLMGMDGTTLAAVSGPVQVPVLVTLPGSKTSQANVGIWVQPAQTLRNPGYPVTTYASTVPLLASAGTTAVALDTVTATGGTGPTYAVTGATGTDASNHTAVAGDFAVSATGDVTIKFPFAPGTFTVTITSTDTGTPALTSETITLTVTVTLT